MKRRGRLVRCAGLLAWLGGTALTADAAGPRWGVALEGNPITASRIQNVVRTTGLRPRLLVFFQQWPEEATANDFPRSSLETIAAAGALPVLTWEPMYYRRVDGAETMISAARITRGDYDAYLDAFAHAAAAWKRPLIIRFAHEMNLSRYHWGGEPDDYGPQSPEHFRAMWRHVVQIFRQAGAANVQWAFCPNCEPVPGAGNPALAPWNTARAYYPGGDVVDVLGVDGYNWGNTQTLEKNGWQSAWRSFTAIFSPMRNELRTLAPDKPLYVFETASAPSGGNKTEWLAELARTAVEWRLDGVVWFEANKEVDWRLGTNVGSGGLPPLRTVFFDPP